MKIDFDHWRGLQIGDEIQNQIALERRLGLIDALNPVFSKDGNQWCYLYGELPVAYIVGFGDTPHEALKAFEYNFDNQKAVVNKQPQPEDE